MALVMEYTVTYGTRAPRFKANTMFYSREGDHWKGQSRKQRTVQASKPGYRSDFLFIFFPANARDRKWKLGRGQGTVPYLLS